MAVGQKVFDPDEIRKTIHALKPGGELFEVRCLESSGNRIYSGYFHDAETLIDSLCRLNSGESNIYITLNDVKEECYSREQRDKFVQSTNSKKPTTGDVDINGYDFLFIDVDPVRPSGTSSSDEQLQKAKATGNKVYVFMKNLGFNDPVTAMSGNGIHLLYRIQLQNNDGNRALVKKGLETLDMFFSNEEVKIDTANINPARICKLYGTMARKGSNTEQNPHRLSHLLSEGSREPTDRIYLEKLVSMIPEKQEKPQKYNNYNPRDFDLEEWLQRYNVRYRKGSYSDGTKFILDECPFDSNHKGKDACIFQARSGAIGFHCFHNSCSDKTWQDVRKLFEPDAYEKRQQEYERKIYSRLPVQQRPIQSIVPVQGNPVFFTARNILDLQVPEERFVKSGIADIDKKLRGLKKGYVTVMSGLRASGKSSVISEMTLDAVESGNNVGIFSGELAPKNFMRWMDLQAAGRGYTEPTQFEGYYNVSRKYKEQIAEWLGQHFFLYNNDYGNDYRAVAEQFEKAIEEKKLDLLILDNLMAFNILCLSDNKFEAQTAFILDMQRIAKKYHVHILFIAHPRKAMGFLRLDDISGTADLGNAVDNALIVHRVNNDFKRLSKQMFGWKDDNPIFSATNVIEIAKDRDGGTQDYFVPLYYEQETKRLKNHPAENKIYGWNKSDDGFLNVEQGEIPFD